MGNKNESLKQNIGFSAIGSVGSQFISLLGFVFLARLLSPHEFGLMAMVAVFTSFAAIFIEMGMGAALIHNQDATIEHESTAFWFNLGLSFLLLGAIDASSGLIAEFFHEPELQNIILVVSILLPLNALSVVPMAILQKSLTFKSVSIVELSGLLAGMSAALILATQGAGVWALVVNLIIVAFMKSTLLFWLSGWRPKRIFKRNLFRELWVYSGHLFYASFFNYFVESVDKVLIGRMLNSNVLGAYDYASRLILLPVNLISNVLNRVMFPFYAAAENQTIKKHVHLKMIRMVFFFVFPILLTTGLLSDLLVLALLGDQWREMVHIVEMFSCIYILRSIAVLNGPVYMSEGATKLLFRMTLFFRGNVLIATIAGIYLDGVNGLLWGLLIARVLNFLPALYFPGKLIGIKMNEYFSAVGATAIATLCTTLVVYITKNAILYDAYSMLDLMFFSGLSVAVYFAFSFLLNRKGMEEIYNLICARRYS